MLNKQKSFTLPHQITKLHFHPEMKCNLFLFHLLMGLTVSGMRVESVHFSDLVCEGKTCLFKVYTEVPTPYFQEKVCS